MQLYAVTLSNNDLARCNQAHNWQEDVMRSTNRAKLIAATVMAAGALMAGPTASALDLYSDLNTDVTTRGFTTVISEVAPGDTPEDTHDM